MAFITYYNQDKNNISWEVSYQSEKNDESISEKVSIFSDIPTEMCDRVNIPVGVNNYAVNITL